MKLLTLAFLAFISASAVRAESADNVLVRVTDIVHELTGVNSPLRDFEVSVRVSFAARVANNTVLVLEDASGSVVAFDARADKNPPLAPGDVIRCSGQIVTVNSRWRQAKILQASLVSRQDPPPLRSVRVSDLSGGQFDYRAVRLTGTVYDARPSETNPDWLLLTITDLSSSIYANIQVRTNALASCADLVGAEITLDGICAPRELGTAARRHAGRTVKAYDLSALRIVKPASEGRRDAPDILTLEGTSADDIPLFRQHGAYGRVIAAWDDQAMIATTNGTTVRLQLLAGPKPTCGQHIVATGFPETDLYSINLNHVSWRTCDDGPEIPPVPSAPIDRFPLRPNILQLHSQYHGRTLKIAGRVLAPPSQGTESGKAYVSTETHLIPVVIPDDGGSTALPAGCQVEITGICVFESERWHPNLVFPKTNGFFLVTRTPSDIRIVAPPPWWTAGRLLTVIGTLLAVLVGILIWNLALRHLAARKGRELFKEQLEHVKADLRTEERTRLAVELHDTLAQNLTGVSMEIEAANDLRGNAPKPMLEHLCIAAKALKSCRDELRNCLWDLRSQALEEPDMTTAVLRTLQPHVNDSQLSVRFNVPRARLSDNTAHALLRVIRELVINAIRHGNASTVKVAGTIDQGRLLCSVADNGCGFDPDNVPGILQGHFGLQGIRERIDDLGGEFSIRSSFGKGTKATISVPVPHMT